MKNQNLNNAKKAKNDEFYTQLVDIEKEMQYHTEHFKNKIVYCNCDDARISNFYKYFSDNFEKLGLKKLICTGYNKNGNGYLMIYTGTENIDDIQYLNGNGDFRSDECIEFLKESDVVLTNPPFSLFREYVAQLMEYNKKFIIIGNNNAITYKDFFPYIKENKVWLGRTLFTGKMPYFKVPNDYPIENERYEKREDGIYKQVNSICWFTNVSNDSNREVVISYRKYNEIDYPKYDNYDAIECNKMCELPMDYDECIGIPITGLKYLHSDGFIHVEINGQDTQFEIISLMNGAKGYGLTNGNDDRAKFYLNNKGVYVRILIKKVQK